MNDARDAGLPGVVASPMANLVSPSLFSPSNVDVNGLSPNSGDVVGQGWIESHRGVFHHDGDVCDGKEDDKGQSVMTQASHRVHAMLERAVPGAVGDVDTANVFTSTPIAADIRRSRVVSDASVHSMDDFDEDDERLAEVCHCLYMVAATVQMGLKSVCVCV